jgi:transcriptional regulator with XRE-family HTH domain
MTKTNQRRSEGAVKASSRSRLFFTLQKAWKRRSKEGMTAKDLAALLDRDKAYVSRVLNGKTPTITIETLALFLDRLDYALVVDCIPAEEIPPVNKDARPRGLTTAKA